MNDVKVFTDEEIFEALDFEAELPCEICLDMDMERNAEVEVFTHFPCCPRDFRMLLCRQHLEVFMHSPQIAERPQRCDVCGQHLGIVLDYIVKIVDL